MCHNRPDETCTLNEKGAFVLDVFGTSRGLKGGIIVLQRVPILITSLLLPLPASELSRLCLSVALTRNMPSPNSRAIEVETPSTSEMLVLNQKRASTSNANETQQERIDVGHRASDAAEGMFFPIPMLSAVLNSVALAYLNKAKL
jgi:hypothetical protein